VLGAYRAAFFAIWLLGMAFFYVHGVAIKAGASSPTETRTAAITEHGRTVYVTAAEWSRKQAVSRRGDQQRELG